MSADLEQKLLDVAADQQWCLALRGAPASGKSTYVARVRAALAAPVRAALAARPVVVVCRDDLRRMLFGGWTGSMTDEFLVSEAERHHIHEALQRGRNVIVDATHLKQRYVDRVEAIARASSTGADFLVDDSFLSVPIELCIHRDAARPDGVRVGGERIRKMWAGHLADITAVAAAGGGER